MESNTEIALPIALEFTKGGSPKITDRDGFSIANLSNTVHKHRKPQGEFIVTACNNHTRLLKENGELKELLKEIDRLNTIIKRLEGIIERYQPTPQSN